MHRSGSLGCESSMSPTEEKRTAPEADDSATDSEAEKAAEGLKSQIDAVRRRIREAQETLREHARRERESKSFKP
jgi:hypothetical protein